MNRSKQIYTDTLSQIKSEGLYKKERTIITPQGVIINTKEGGEVLNFCANNYLGLSNNPDIKDRLISKDEKYTAIAVRSAIIDAVSSSHPFANNVFFAKSNISFNFKETVLTQTIKYYLCFLFKSFLRSSWSPTTV